LVVLLLLLPLPLLRIRADVVVAAEVVGRQQQPMKLLPALAPRRGLPVRRPALV
jgi:hypothetical protein